MPIDTSMYAQALRPVPTVADNLNALNQQDLEQQKVAQNRLALASGQQQFDEAKAVSGEKNSLRAYLSDPSVDLTTAAGQNGLYQHAPTLAPGIIKTMQEGLTSRALAAKDQGSADESKQKIKDQAFAHFQNVLGTVENPQQAAAFITANYQDPIVGPMLSQRGTLQDSIAHLQQVTQTPEGFQQWKANAAIGMQKLAEMAKTQQVDSGGQTSTQIVQPATGQVQTLSTVKNTVSPNTSATISAENERARLSRQTQLQVAGMDANGNYNLPTIAAPAGTPATPGAPGAPATPAKGPTSALQGLVDGLGSYQIPESTAFSRMTAPAKSAVLQAVKAQYPDYDPTVYTERNASSRAFAPNGKNGQAVKSFNVGLAHLDTLSELADKLDNGQVPVLNAAGNYIAKQTGDTAQTNFAAAKNIVTDEVVKAIVGGGGGVGDREKAAETINAAQTPQQLKEAIHTVRTLMGGQLIGLEQAYKAGTGRNDFRTKYLVPEAQRAVQGLTQTAPGAAPASTAPGWTILGVH